MSTRPDELLDQVADADRLADAVEAHLDAHPFVVDEAEIDAAASRLEARMGRARPVGSAPWRLVFVGLAVVAAVWVGSILVSPPRDVAPVASPPATPEMQVIPSVAPPMSIDAVDRPERMEFPAAGREVTVAQGSHVLASERGRSAVLLVREGSIDTGKTVVGSGNWALLTHTDDAADVDVVFPDGQAPPALDPAVWGDEPVAEQLRGLRWESLPTDTLSTLEALLEER